MKDLEFRRVRLKTTVYRDNEKGRKRSTFLFLQF